MTEYDELGTQLTRTLTEHADVMAGSSLGFAGVQDRARRIRRRRTATAVAGVAAAVALIVPTVSLATHTSGKPEPAPATRTPSPTQTVTEVTGHQPAPGVLDVSDLPTGTAPHIDFVDHGVLHQADGGTAEVGTTYPVDQFVALADGSRTWHTSDHGKPYVEVQDADGTLSEPVRSEWGLAVNAKHTIAAWVTPAGQVMVYGAGASEPTPLGDPITTGNDLRVAAVSGDDCSLACSVDVNVSGPEGDWQPWEVSDAGSQELRDGGFLIVDDISQAGLTAGRTKLTDFGSCSKVVGGGEFAGWSTSKNQLHTFSADGSLVLGYPPYFDGLGPGSIAMLDAGNGDRLFERSSTAKTQAFFSGAFWEDGSHALAPVFQDGSWGLIRFASDGSMEYAVPPASGRDMDNPYVIATN
jgi:hypothetical protein